LVATLDHKTELDETCYAAPAGKPFQIVFTNNTTALNGKPLVLSLSLYRSQEDAYSVTDDGAEYEANLDNALFVGKPIKAPAKIEYDIPPLQPGTYFLQDDLLATIMNAWLIVS